MRSKQFAVCAIAGLLLGAMAHQARAAFTINIFQNGSDVDAVGNGSFNLSALTLNQADVPSQPADSVFGAHGFADLGTGPLDEYIGITGPSSFGTGGSEDASAVAGPFTGIFGEIGEVDVPNGYTSGTFVSDSATYSNQTLATLSLTPGLYTYTWGSGPTADTLVVDIGTAVPEPASASLVAAGGLLILRRRRVSR
jgi:hypothetical protein